MKTLPAQGSEELSSSDLYDSLGGSGNKAISRQSKPPETGSLPSLPESSKTSTHRDVLWG